MDAANILRIITNSTWMVTRLISRGDIQFRQDVYYAQVMENSEPGPILQLSVSVTSNSDSVSFQITKGDPQNLFLVDNETGKLFNRRPLDFENASRHELLVEARLGDKKSEAQVIVTVRDVNDHEPSFFRQKYETQITEEDDRHLPKKILTVTAHDGDVGEYGQLIYSLHGAGTSASTDSPSFSIDRKTGDLYVLKPLDRDPPTGNPRWDLEVAATDGRSTATTTITVNVKDINDNVPYFLQDIVYGSVRENSQEGAEVLVMKAQDNDDVMEGFNAVINYSLEKNVIDEASSRPLFAVDGHTGRVTTSLCCLDREETPQYSIHVVATDGGGLKGTGTVIVEISDENDEPPRFSEREWNFTVDEVMDSGKIVASLTIEDKDENNDFAFRILPDSGPGWQFFSIEGNTNSRTAYLRAKSLDYENPVHKQGFRFFVQVSDLGKEGFNLKSHVDGTWVRVTLKDVNDNMPIFKESRAHAPRQDNLSSPHKVSIRISEGTPRDTVLATFSVDDQDQEGKAMIRFNVDLASDPTESFNVDDLGVVRLNAPLDREQYANYNVLVVATDFGNPPLSSTATLQVEVMDVNDNPPFIVEPLIRTITEGLPPQIVGHFYLGDPDDWTMGHGPPFSVQMDPNAPHSVKDVITISFDSGGGPNGFGEGTIRTIKTLDRERTRSIFVPLVASDSANPKMTSSLTLTVVVSDVNDNGMTAGEKKVYVLKTESSYSVVPIGRVYVHDRDDWDASEKTYEWKETQPLFSLDPDEGTVVMLPEGKQGRYDLNFLVSDDRHKLKNVPAKVSVEVHSVSSTLLRAAVPLIMNIPPSELIAKENEEESILERFENLIESWIRELLNPSESDSRSTKLYKRNQLELKQNRNIFKDNFFQEKNFHVVSMLPEDQRESRTKLFVAAPDIVNLGHLLLLAKAKIESELSIVIGLVGKERTCSPENTDFRRISCSPHCDVDEENFWLVDANVTSRVGPRISEMTGCNCYNNVYFRSNVQEDPIKRFRRLCYPNPCSNAGKCIPDDDTGFRCECTSNTQGPLCKILIRTFEGGVFDGGGLKNSPSDVSGSWSWVSPPSICKHGSLSFEILTTDSDAVILYWGHVLYHKDTRTRSRYRRSTARKVTDKKNGAKVNVTQSNKIDLIEKTRIFKSRKSEKLLFRIKSDIYESDLSKSTTVTVLLPQKLNYSQNQSPLENSGPNLRIGSIYPENKTSHTQSTNRSHHTNAKISVYEYSNAKKYRNRIISSQYLSFKVGPNHSNLSDSLGNTKNQAVLGDPSTLDRNQANISEIEALIGRGRDHPQSPQFVLKRDRRQLLHRNPRNLPDLLLLELIGGQPHVTMNLQGKQQTLTVNKTLNDNHWHRIDLSWKDKEVELVIDLCADFEAPQPSNLRLHKSSSVPYPLVPLLSSSSSERVSQGEEVDLSYRKLWKRQIRESLQSRSSSYASLPVLSTYSADSVCRKKIQLRSSIEKFLPSSPISLGSFNDAFEKPKINHWSVGNPQNSLKGCLRNFRVNEELKDLGYNLISQNSHPGCSRVNCETDDKRCSPNQICSGSPQESSCRTCKPGFKGDLCNIPTIPVSFHSNSSLTLYLETSEFTVFTSLQIRIRTREKNATILRLSSSEGTIHLSLDLNEGNLCLGFIPNIDGSVRLCLDRVKLNDGKWHSIMASRKGIGSFLSVDGGDENFFNSSLSPNHQALIEIDSNETIRIGAQRQQLQDDGTLTEHSYDFRRGCLDDLRLDGKPLPLSATSTRNPYAKITEVNHVTKGCPSVMACAENRCSPPLTCIDTWRSYKCGCSEGNYLSQNGSCASIKECDFAPCFNRGVCFELPTGFSCSCPDGFNGRYCELEDSYSLAAMSVAATAGIIGIAFLLLSVCVLLFRSFLRGKQIKKNRSPGDGRENSYSSAGGVREGGDFISNNMEMNSMRPPDINGQATWGQAASITHVDVVPVSAVLQNGVMNNLDADGAKRSVTLPNGVGGKVANIENNGNVQNGGEDLRNYAYEGDGSSPGSLSSCLESCSGSFKFLGGFREVDQILDEAPHQQVSNNLEFKSSNNKNVAIDTKNIHMNNISAMTPVDDCNIIGSQNNKFYPLNQSKIFNQNEKVLERRKSDNILNAENAAEGKSSVFYTTSSNLLLEAPEGFKNDC